MATLTGAVAVVSGGARGMGAGHVRGLVAEGAKVVFGDVLDDEGRALATEVGASARYVHLDVTSEGDWVHAVAEAEAAFGPVTVLVNNAGILAFGSVETTSPADFRKVIDVNLTGTFLGMHAAIPSLKKAGGGVIVNIASTAGMMGYASIGAYVASKWGMRGLTKTAALELGPAGMRVVSIHPGPITTPMVAGMSESMAATQPIARFGSTQEVTKLLLFLVADATYSTGAEFVIDGGALLGPVVPNG
jgi:3alpha(or 20beta)-hydroxysteroid dehydrogenase